MKRFLALALTTLMLCGCDFAPPVETTPPTTPSTEPIVTEPPVQVRQPLEQYPLPYTDLREAVPMGKDILLTVGEPAMLVKLQSHDLAQDASVRLPEGASVLAVTDDGVCYAVNGTLVFLDARLRECGRVTLPLSATGTPLVSQDLQRIYYTAGKTIRSVSRTNGHDRPLRDTTAQELTLIGLHIQDTILKCQATDANGIVSTLFFDPTTGELVMQYDHDIDLFTGAEGWFATISQNGYVQNLVSKDGTLIQALSPSYTYNRLDYLDNLKGVVITTVHDGYLSLDFCAIDTGFSQAMTPLNGVAEIRSLWGDATQNCIWVLTDQDTLFRWDLALTEVEDQVSCITPFYTRENPDTDGLLRLEEQVQALEKQSPIDLHIGEDALTLDAEGYTLISEYRVPVLGNGLNVLSHALSQLDGKFLTKVAEVSQDDRIHISLVQSVTGSVEQDTPVSCTTAHFWNHGNACIVLALGDGITQDFHHGLYHVMDAQILSRSSVFDNWEDLNPPDFEYDYSYNLNQNREDLTVPDAFIDTFSMSFPTEDRARIFQYAMMEEGEAVFQSQSKQAKLAVLCTGIREAFGITSKKPLPWEQYLESE